jgi:uncharacterized protein (TIGR00661 family)
MKILYAIQATGNGHISRAREIIPYLLKHGELDLLVSGRQAEVQLPYLVKYKKPGISYTFGKKGGIDMIDSFKHLRPFHFFRDISTFPVNDYDLVINDFEPVTAWACKLKRKQCIALGHQASFISSKTPRPKHKEHFGETVLTHYAPATHHIGFHFSTYDKFIHTPVIRQDVRKLESTNREHITVYLPAHGDDVIIDTLKRVKEVEWQVFSKHSHETYRVKNVSVQPVVNEHFLESLASGNGLVTAAGFESPAEAIYLGKKVLAVPMVNQYEQLCNAEAMRRLGVTVIDKIDAEFAGRLKSWINFGKIVPLVYKDETEHILSNLVEEFGKPGSRQV